MNEKVLVVDDNDANRRMMMDVLEQWGYQVGEAKNGREVMRLVDEFLPDLILLDVMLPGMNGYEICYRLKRDQRTDHIAIIMLTVLNDSESRTRGISVGADLFVSRPPNYQEMHKNIESLLLNKRKYRRMESLDALRGFLEEIVRAISPDEYERYRVVLGYAVRTAKIVGVDEENLRCMEMGGLCCALEKVLLERGAEASSLTNALVALNNGPCIERFMEYQRHPAAAHVEHLAAAVYCVCARYCGLKAEGASDEAALEDASATPIGYAARMTVEEALRQVISDEAFLKLLGDQDAPERA